MGGGAGTRLAGAERADAGRQAFLAGAGQGLRGTGSPLALPGTMPSSLLPVRAGSGPGCCRRCVGCGRAAGRSTSAGEEDRRPPKGQADGGGGHPGGGRAVAGSRTGVEGWE
ncbi:hypothetical protein GCM10010220_13860 [Streptomyces parvulus]|nr:hypothetical protein GCM10010220_13860 [Streptomyces parvulus]